MTLRVLDPVVPNALHIFLALAPVAGQRLFACLVQAAAHCKDINEVAELRQPFSVGFA
jgi:hypothetical protein